MLIDPNVTQVPLALPKSGEKEMLSVFEENGRTVVRINYSSLSIIQECPRKAYYNFERGLRSKSDSPATVFGTAIHKALEIFYSEPRENRSIPVRFKDHSDLMAFGTPAPTEHFLYKAVQGFIDSAEPLRALPDDDKRSISNGVWILQEYFAKYINDPFEVYCDEKGPITERRCEAVVYEDAELKIILFGTIDVILQNKQTNVVLPADHKTSSIVGNDFYNRLKPNLQYSAYSWLAKEVLKIDSNVFMVNCIGVKARPKTSRGSGPDFPRQVTTRTEADFVEFKESVIEGVQRFLGWREAGVWPLGSVNVCTFWGGCSFLEVCGAPEEIRGAMIENKFQTTKEVPSEIK